MSTCCGSQKEELCLLAQPFVDNRPVDERADNAAEEIYELVREVLSTSSKAFYKDRKEISSTSKSRKCLSSRRGAFLTFSQLQVSASLKTVLCPGEEGSNTLFLHLFIQESPITKLNFKQYSVGFTKLSHSQQPLQVKKNWYGRTKMVTVEEAPGSEKFQRMSRS